MITCLTLVSVNFDFSVGSKLIYFKVFTHFLLKKKALNGDKNNYWGKHISPLQENWNWSILTFFQHQDNFEGMFLSLHINYLTQKPAIAFYAVQKSQQPTANKNVTTASLPFKLRSKRTSWCRCEYLAFHGQKCKSSCSVCFSLEIAFNSTKAWILHERLKNSSQFELAQFLVKDNEPCKSSGLGLSSHYDTVTNLPHCKTHPVSQWGRITWQHEVISLN